MVSETNDMVSFLAQHPPFNTLKPSQLEYASTNMFVAFAKSGAKIILEPAPDNINNTGMIILRSGSLELRTASGKLFDRLSAGDYVLTEQINRKDNASLSILVLEDCLYYELTDYALLSLSTCSNEIANLLNNAPINDAPSSPEGNVHEQAISEQIAENSYLNQRVSTVMSEGIISVPPGASIQQAAILMKQHRISCLLILDADKLIGIVTDRDLRSRVLAKGIAYSSAIETVITRSPCYINADSHLYDAHLKMLSEGIHHLPVKKDKKTVGILTLSDILRANNAEPLSLIRAINRADTSFELAEAAENLPGLVVKLIERDARAVDIGKIITSFSDGITKRLIRLAIRKLGQPPCDFAWLAFGSQARQEQVLGSDQDNGLLLPNGIDINQDYFKKFSTYINNGLNRCGMPYCPGNIMASNDKWRQSLSAWQACFSQWIEQPTPKAVMHSSIFFDMRHIAGNAQLTQQLQQHVLHRGKNNTIFLAMMCDNALLHSPPLGFFKTFVLESDGDHNNALNLKKRGTIPIVDIARNYALSTGLAQLNSIERLHAIQEAGVMSKEMTDSLIDAHEFIAGIRLQAQGKQYRDKQPINNYLDPCKLSPLVRHQLKDAFSLVRDAQSAMRVRFGGGVI